MKKEDFPPEVRAVLRRSQEFKTFERFSTAVTKAVIEAWGELDVDAEGDLSAFIEMYWKDRGRSIPSPDLAEKRKAGVAKRKAHLQNLLKIRGL